MAGVQIASIRQEAQTWDEGTHLAAGLSYWKTGDYRMNPEHPPLAKLLCALPLLFMNVRLPFEFPSWNQRDELNFGAQFLYANLIPADEILFPARCVTIALTLMLGCAIAWWTRKYFGAPAALLALALFALDPNIIAHGRYVTTDLLVALCSFAACALWGMALRERTWPATIAAGVALGLALGSKFSSLFLIPAFAALALVRRPGWKAIAVVFGTAYVVLMVLYLPDVLRSPSMLPPAFLTGLQDVITQSQEGRPAYLLGHFSQMGWWYYFPLAFLVKTPTALIALTLFSLGALVWKWRQFPFELAVLAIPAAIYWAFCLQSRIDLGLRHLLPAYVLLIPIVAAVAIRFVPRPLLAGLVVLLALESFSIYPNYLAFFNWPSGGASNGPHYLLDSNIDWGQDTKKLKAWLDPQGIHQVCRAYFGMAILAHYGIGELPLPGNNEIEARRNLDCMAAASVTPLYGLYVQDDKYRWLREMTPVAKIGYSIYVYDLRKRK